jgi:hypothetical protein
MVTRIAFLLSLALAAFLTAGCGDGNQDVSPTTAAPISASATSTPAGPQAIVEPRSGPPGTEITVRGSGWDPGVLIDLTAELTPGTAAEPYETVLSGQDGSFTARFRLEATPDGTALETGRYNLIARSTGGQVTIPFLVETRRPVGSSGPSG